MWLEGKSNPDEKYGQRIWTAVHRRGINQGNTDVRCACSCFSLMMQKLFRQFMMLNLTEGRSGRMFEQAYS